MATLTTGVVNAGYPVSGAPAVIPRGAVSYFSIVNSACPLVNATNVRVSVFAQTDFTDTTARKSLVYNNPITNMATVRVAQYTPIVKNVAFVTYSIETTRVLQVDVDTNPFYLANTVTVKSAVNETKEGTVGFYHKVAEHKYITLLKNIAVDPATNYNNIYNNGVLVNTFAESKVATMDNASFNQSLSTRQYVGQVTLDEPNIVSLNVLNSSTNQNSPKQVVLNNVTNKIVDQNTNSGRINSSAIQPKGSEKSNIKFAQAFGNTTIVGKWF